MFGRPRLAKGGDMVKVIRRGPPVKNRHGDASGGTSTMVAGPCDIAYESSWSSVSEVRTGNRVVVDRDVALFFDTKPDIRMGDDVVLPNSKSYRVVSVSPWRSRFRGVVAGFEVTLQGLETT